METQIYCDLTSMLNPMKFEQGMMVLKFVFIYLLNIFVCLDISDFANRKQCMLTLFEKKDVLKLQT